MTVRGKIGKKRVSLLGYGAMRLPMADGQIDQAEVNRQVRYMLEHGLNYFDTAPVYCDGKSEGALGRALSASGFGREEYAIATKLSNFSPTKWSLDSVKAMFENSLRELRTNYIDNYLLHSVGGGGMAAFSKRYLNNGALDWCRKLRDEERIRNLGFSFHGDMKVFDYLLDRHNEIHWDFCMIQMNYIDWEHASRRDVNAKLLYGKLSENHIPVVVMEPLLGGRLAQYNWALASELKPLHPEDSLARWAFRFCGSYDNVFSILSGMTYAHHIEENLETFSPLKPLDAAEMAAVRRAGDSFLNLKTIPCTNCQYCMPCPYGIDIPGLFAFRNRVSTARTPSKARELLTEYAEAIPEPLRRADHCIGCARCLHHCPQAIAIPEEIAKIDAWIDSLKCEAAQSGKLAMAMEAMEKLKGVLK